MKLIIVPGLTVTYDADGNVIAAESNTVPAPEPTATNPRPPDGPAWQALADAQTLGDIREAAATIVGGA